MSEMVECAAKAMRDKLEQHAEECGCHWYDYEGRKFLVSYEGDIDFEELARAAIAAMHEPTHEMHRAGVAAMSDTLDADAGWQAMIDAALAEEKQSA